MVFTIQWLPLVDSFAWLWSFNRRGRSSGDALVGMMRGLSPRQLVGFAALSRAFGFLLAPIQHTSQPASVKVGDQADS
jgi:hypothetical protein